MSKPQKPIVVICPSVGGKENALYLAEADGPGVYRLARFVADKVTNEFASELARAVRHTQKANEQV